MNSLSWLFLFAEWSSSVKGVLTALSVISFLVALAALIIYLIITASKYSRETMREGYRSRYSGDDIEKLQLMQNTDQKMVGKFLKVFIPIFLISLIISVGLPSSRTIYMIAASELGESVLINSDIPALANDYVELLRAQLGIQLEAVTEAVTP